MYARRNNFLLLVALFAAPSLAHARKVTFSTGSPFGMGFRVAAASAPTTTVVAAPRNKSSSYGTAYSFEPFFDFTNFVARGYVTLHNHPTYSGSGTGFSESTEASGVSYGVQLLLAPLVSETRMSRGYFVAGVGRAISSFKTTGNTLDGAGSVVATYLERARGRKEELTAGLGYEVIFVQNYSLQLEFGYRRLEFDRITYEGDGDRDGNARAKGEVIIDPTTGKNREFDQSGVYASLAFNLNF